MQARKKREYKFATAKETEQKRITRILNARRIFLERFGALKNQKLRVNRIIVLNTLQQLKKRAISGAFSGFSYD